MGLVAQVGEEDVVELEVATTCVVEGLYCFGVGRADVGEEEVGVGVFRWSDVVGCSPEVTRTRTRDRNLGCSGGDRGQIPEMIQHRVVIGKVDALADFWEVRAKLWPRELHAGAISALHHVQAGETVHEVVVPERSSKLAIGHEPEAERLLHGDDVGDSCVLGRFEIGRRQRSIGECRGPGFDDCRWPKQAANMIGSEERISSVRHSGLRSCSGFVVLVSLAGCIPRSHSPGFH